MRTRHWLRVNFGFLACLINALNPKLAITAKKTKVSKGICPLAFCQKIRGGFLKPAKAFCQSSIGGAVLADGFSGSGFFCFKARDKQEFP